MYNNFITSAVCKRGLRYTHRLKTKAVSATYKRGDIFLSYRNLYIFNMVKDVNMASFEPEHQEFTDIKNPIRGD